MAPGSPRCPRSTPSQLATASAIDPKTSAALTANPADTAAATTAVGEIATKFKVTPAVATARLVALSKVPKADLAFLTAHGPAVQSAAAAAPGQWKHWWWVCVGGEAVFIPFIWLMTGRWRPRKARQDADEHEARLQEELAALKAYARSTDDDRGPPAWNWLGAAVVGRRRSLSGRRRRCAPSRSASNSTAANPYDGCSTVWQKVANSRGTGHCCPGSAHVVVVGVLGLADPLPGRLLPRSCRW